MWSFCGGGGGPGVRDLARDGGGPVGQCGPCSHRQARHCWVRSPAIASAPQVAQAQLWPQGSSPASLAQARAQEGGARRYHRPASQAGVQWGRGRSRCGERGALRAAAAWRAGEAERAVQARMLAPHACGAAPCCRGLERAALRTAHTGCAQQAARAAPDQSARGIAPYYICYNLENTRTKAQHLYRQCPRVATISRNTKQFLQTCEVAVTCQHGRATARYSDIGHTVFMTYPA